MKISNEQDLGLQCQTTSVLKIWSKKYKVNFIITLGPYRNSTTSIIVIIDKKQDLTLMCLAWNSYIPCLSGRLHVPKNYGVQKHLCQKKSLVKEILVRKNLWSKKFWSQKILGLKRTLGSKNCGSNMILWAEKIWCPQIFLGPLKNFWSKKLFV